MEDSKKIFIRGSKEHGDKVIKYLEEIANRSFYGWNGKGSDGIYFLSRDANSLGFLKEDDEMAGIVMDCYKEVTIEEVLAYFTKKEDRWDYDNNRIIKGYRIMADSNLVKVNFTVTIYSKNIFATEKQAKSALAMAQISQYMANDKRYGGVVTDEEWDDYNIVKYVIFRCKSKCEIGERSGYYQFLAFHTTEQRVLFLEEHEDLVKDYLMID